MIRLSFPLAVGAFLAMAPAIAAGPAQAVDPGPDGLVLACSGPFARDADRAALVARFGAGNVRDEDVGGAEGDTVSATVLYPDDPKRRLEITWWDEAGRRRPATIRTREDGSAWTIVGIGIGSPLAAVTAANGRAFALSGFGWDYGGLVTDWSGGTLPQTVGAGCSLQMGFSPGKDAADAIMGDGVVLRSDEPQVLASEPTVIELGLGWPEQ